MFLLCIEDDFMTPTVFFKCLADDIRVKTLLMIVKEGELCVCELMTALNEQSQPKVSRHLALLKTTGLLIARKEKQWVFYALNPTLPNWAVQVLSSTLNDNLAFIEPNIEQLNAMGDRPTRVATCCD